MGKAVGKIMSNIIPGQRYMSTAEPELGLGLVSEIQEKMVTLFFPAAEEMRRYGIYSAPLKRIQFDIGDEITSSQGQTITVKEITTSDVGILIYTGEDHHVIAESELSDTINFHSPEEKLLNASTDRFSLFQLRHDTFHYSSWLAQLKVRGLIGARISLIEHQYYIADTITKRLYPRVLLADEVGLGKTIETGLIIHRMLITGRAERILIVTPNSLNIQWFIEMQRKYHLSFSIINEQTELDSKTNYFDENNLVITSLDFLTTSENSSDYALSADWDILIVDEVHKLLSHEYQIIEKLAKKAKGLLLLTATPELNGFEEHFSHLQLIDPDMFYDLEIFKEKEKLFKQSAQKARFLLDEKKYSVNDEVIKELIDSHGPGRVYFRNTRETIDQEYHYFPIRHLLNYPLSNQSKISWLIEMLRSHPDEKYLLICRSKEMVLSIENDLKRLSTGNKIGVFHEGLSLMARDRQAAYFRESDGANILLCSEIGSEGRNFQFCQNLILFDLPMSADLLEQRIGRLDRIGQKKHIFLHVPYEEKTQEEFLYEWYHQVFNAFIAPIKGASSISKKYFDEYIKVEDHETKLREEIIRKAKQDFLSLKDLFRTGRDILIELNSFNQSHASEIVEEIKKIDQSPKLKEYLENVYTHFGVDVEDLDENSQYIRPGDNMYIAHFPFLKSEGFSYTYDRQVALEREDLAFMSWDHPMVIGIMELICGEEYGNSTLMTRKNHQVKHFIETFHLLYPQAPKELETQRFLPPTMIRTLIDLEGNDFSAKWSKEILDEKLEDAPIEIKHKAMSFSKQKIKELIKQTKNLALKNQDQIKQTSIVYALTYFDEEINRLKKLKEINPLINPQEIDHLQQKRDQVIKAIEEAPLNIDSLRFIY